MVETIQLLFLIFLIFITHNLQRLWSLEIQLKDVFFFKFFFKTTLWLYISSFDFLLNHIRWSPARLARVLWIYSRIRLGLSFDALLRLPPQSPWSLQRLERSRRTQSSLNFPGRATGQTYTDIAATSTGLALTRGGTCTTGWGKAQRCARSRKYPFIS